MRAIGTLPLRRYTNGSFARFLAREIIGQQLSIFAARAIWRRVEECLRERGEGIPQFLNASNAKALRACGVSPNKVRALLALNAAYEAGKLNTRKLARMDHVTRSAELAGIWGIGQWTCDMASIFFFGDADVWPSGDRAVTRTLEGFLHGRHKRTSSDLIAKRFMPYRSLLALYLWEIIDSERQTNAT